MVGWARRRGRVSGLLLLQVLVVLAQFVVPIYFHKSVYHAPIAIPKPKTTRAPSPLKEMPFSSPACLPFRYNNTRHGTPRKIDYYEEFWSGKTVKRPTRIKFLHMRKAGGTSLGQYLDSVVESNATSFQTLDHCEGKRHCLELDQDTDGYRMYYDATEQVNRRKHAPPKGYDSSGATLYVTHLREPVARALSNYKYSLRFWCPARKKGTRRNPTMTLGEFSTRANLNPHANDTLPGPNELWDCNSNCYARWATGMYNPRGVYTARRKSRLSLSEFDARYPSIAAYYHRRTAGDAPAGGGGRGAPTDFGRALPVEALRLLRRFDVIVVLEWLRDPHYARLVEDTFFGGVRGIDNAAHAWCDPQMHRLNERDPLEVPDATLARLRGANEIDTHLYRTLTACGQ